jgi:hypothetical protein
LIFYLLLITPTLYSELTSIGSSAKPSVQRKIPEALRIICHDRLGTLESLVGPQAFGDSVVSKNTGRLAEAISGVQDRVRLGAVLTNVSAAAGRMFEDPEPLRLLQPGALGVWNNNHVGRFVQIINKN